MLVREQQTVKYICARSPFATKNQLIMVQKLIITVTSLPLQGNDSEAGMGCTLENISTVLIL